ncbi:MAG TPA: arylsulfatase [Luteolibacter sp.]|nr:arylsulfatase [Luteolibacter sp.]
MNLIHRLLALGMIPLFCTAAPAEEKRMNIVLLYADDLGYGDLGCYNPASKIPTPQLDRLASEGLRFTDAHSSSGICTPSRYALLTGRSHWRDFHGIDRGFDPPFFKPGQLTLPEMIRSRGYTTACIGKWHLGMDWKSIRKPGSPPASKKHDDFDWSRPIRGGAVDHGFDYYFGDNVINFPPYTWIENDRVLAVPDNTLKKTPQNTKEGHWECREGPGRSDWDFYQILPTLTEKAVEYIHARKDGDKPFFLYFPLPSPHAPIVPTDEFDGRSKAGPYGDFVVQTDDSCGRLLNALRETGLYENTIILFTADNGAEAYAYPRDEKYDHWSSDPLRGLKRDIYEGGHRVPTLLKWPGVTQPGSVTGALFSQVDLMATLAAYLGYELPRESAEDSHDFLPYLRGEEKVSPRTTLVHNTYKDRYAIRHHEWLLVDHPTGTDRQPPAAWMEKHKVPPYTGLDAGLYNLKEDLGQRHNLAGKHPEKVAELREMLKSIRNGKHTAPRLAE